MKIISNVNNLKEQSELKFLPYAVEILQVFYRQRDAFLDSTSKIEDVCQFYEFLAPHISLNITMDFLFRVMLDLGISDHHAIDVRKALINHIDKKFDKYFALTKEEVRKEKEKTTHH